MRRTPLSAYAIALATGLFLTITPASRPLALGVEFVAPLLVSAALFGIAGFFTGAMWPGNGWRWGVWIVAPGLVLVVMGLFSSGDIGQFLFQDIPYLAAGVVAAGVGSELGSKVRRAAT